MIDLQECRKEIDVIDKEILRLFENEWKSVRMLQNTRYIQENRFWIPREKQDKLDVLEESGTWKL